MRKKTAPQIRKNREASSRKASGLIAQDLSAQQSATLDCVLDNRSHRTKYWVASRLFDKCSPTQSKVIAARPREPTLTRCPASRRYRRVPRYG